jgi:hypothetical protein
MEQLILLMHPLPGTMHSLQGIYRAGDFDGSGMGLPSIKTQGTR